MMRRLALLLAATILSGLSAYANCNWNTAPRNMNFGTYSVFGAAPVTATSTFRFTCTPNTTATLTLLQGSSAAYNLRTMLGASSMDVLGYNLYLDPANTSIWGDGTSGTQYLTFNALPGDRSLSGRIYGTIPPSADAAAGAYSDTIQATLDWGSGTLQRYFQVRATVPAECVVSTAPVLFGLYDPVTANAAAPKDATGTVDVNCTRGTSVVVSLNRGSHRQGANRRMLGTSGDFLGYELYTDAGRTTVWNTANTASGTSATMFAAIDGGFTAYGRVFGGQDVGAGSYDDTVLVTVNY